MPEQGHGRGADRTVVCVTADDGRFDSTRRAASDLAGREDAELILYDWDAATVLGDPLPSVWSAEGTDESVPDRLDETALEAAGRHAIARQVRDAKASGLAASGWLPAKRGTEALIDFAADHQAIAIVVPAELEMDTNSEAAVRVVVA